MHPVRAAVAAAIAMVPLLGQQGAGWKLSEVASSATLGGLFRHAAVTADSRTLLTFGEFGDAILWDLPSGTLRQRFRPERQEYLPWYGRVALHPRDPWAVVLRSEYGPERVTCFRLDLATGRYQPMRLRQVRSLAFDASGTRAAVLSKRDDGGFRLSIYAAAALHSDQPQPPDFACDIDDGRSGVELFEVLFHPVEPSVFALGVGTSWRVPLDGGVIGRGPENLQGFLSDGSPVLFPYRTKCVGMHWVRVTQQKTIERGGVDECRWTAANRYWGDPVLAADGTVVVPDDQGALEVLGPRPDQRRTLRGHCGPVLSMCFDATGRWFASAGHDAVDVLDLSTGAARRVEGAFAVQPAPREAAFLLLSSRGVDRIDAATLVRSAVVVLPAAWEARTFVLSYSDGQRGNLPWLWQPELGDLWFSGALPGQREESVRLVHGVPGALPEPKRGTLDKTSARPIEILATPTGVVIAATSAALFPSWMCGGGTHSSSLSCFGDKGQLLGSTAVEQVIAWMRMSPGATRLAVGGALAGVQLFDARDLQSIRTIPTGGWPGGVRRFEFLDEDTALASDGFGQVFVLDLTSGRSERVPLPALPPITRLCLSSDGALVALAGAGEVHVLRRQ